MRRGEDSQILSTSWLRLCRPAVGVGGTKQRCLCFDLKKPPLLPNGLPIFEVFNPQKKNKKNKAGHRLGNVNAGEMQVGKCIFTYSLINFIDFHSQKKRRGSRKESGWKHHGSFGFRLSELCVRPEQAGIHHAVPNDHCDRAGLYLEDTRGPLKRQNNGYVGIRWRH